MARAESGEKGSVSKRFWQLASGQHPASPFTEYMDEARAEIDKELRGMGMTPERKASDRVTEINFRRMMSMLEAVEDEDAEFLEAMVARGVTLGVDEEMPRTPKVFEEAEVVTRLCGLHTGRAVLLQLRSAVENQKDIKRQVAEEVQEGTILCLPEEEARRRFKGRLAVAALGAVPKELGSEKVRMIHDGSYSVDVNRRIKVRDRLRFPLCDDAAAVLTEIEEEVSKTIRKPVSPCCMISAGLTN